MTRLCLFLKKFQYSDKQSLSNMHFSQIKSNIVDADTFLILVV